jgi:hypothetical protein
VRVTGVNHDQQEVSSVITDENTVFVMNADDEIQRMTQWSDTAEDEARSIGGYLVVVNSEPANVVADYRPVTLAHDDVALIYDLIEVALQQDGFFDVRVESEARPMTEALFRRVARAIGMKYPEEPAKPARVPDADVMAATEPDVLQEYGGHVYGEYDNDDGSWLLIEFPDVRSASSWVNENHMLSRATLQAEEAREFSFTDIITVKVSF